jgi:transcriptional regulator of NAD metabolism|tara:strand:+ start:763 stop:945 length:183 start_codon:yes stop_codon:yes gene_type:complete
MAKMFEELKEYKFELTIEGVDGKLSYTIDAHNEQEARDAVSYFVHSMPFQIKLLVEVDDA